MTKKILFICLFLSLTLTGCGDKDDTTKNSIKNNGQEEILKIENDISEQNNLENNVNEEDLELLNNLINPNSIPSASFTGSCNSIKEDSTCTEYSGSIWPEAQIKSLCMKPEDFSKEHCPDKSAGACKIGDPTFGYITTWFYLQGGGEINSISLKGSEEICKINPNAEWLTK